MTPFLPIATASYFTLGCKLNFAETSTIGKILASRGIRRAAPHENPDLCVINTCSVTEVADKKGRRLLRHLAAKYPDALIIATGCYAQLKPQEVASIEGVDIVLGSNEKLRIADFIDQWIEKRELAVSVTPALKINDFSPSCEKGDRTRYFLKVQDGCDYFCTYCTIPFARGRSRNGSIADMVAQARNVVSEGGKEIVLTGVNTGDFGRSTGETFLDLLKALDKVDGIERYRISSIEPNLLTPEIIRWVARESRHFTPHFHIPLQAGTDEILRLMNRRYSTSLFRERVDLIRSEIPDAYIGVDMIAGARGETAELWERSFNFAQSLAVTKFHAFPYSERPGTKALSIDFVVDQAEKHRRIEQLTRLSDEKTSAFIAGHSGTVRDVLWEQAVRGTDRMHGLTDNYIRVEAPLDPTLTGKVTKARLGLPLDSNNLSLLATVVV